MLWEELNVIDFKESLEKTKGVCIFPIGCLEKHGYHLPLGTDIMVAREIAIKAAEIEDAMVFPYYPLGVVAEVKHKAGTVSISSTLQFQVMEAIFDELARNGYNKIIIGNGHGGNANFMSYFTQAMLEKKKDYIVLTHDLWTINAEQKADLEARFGEIPKGGHACYSETSRIMAIRPDLVHPELVVEEESYPTGKADWYWENGVVSGMNWYADYPHQIAGNPKGASAEFGKAEIKYGIENLAKIIKKLKDDNTMFDLLQEFYSKHSNPEI